MRNLLRHLDKRRTASNLFVLVVVVLFYMLLSHISDVVGALGTLYSYVSPFIAGIILAYILHPVCALFETHVFKWIKAKKARRGISVCLAMLTALAAIIFLVWSMVPQLIDSIKTLVNDMDSYAAAFTEKLNELNERVPYIDLNVEDLVEGWRTAFDKIVAWVMNNITNILNTSYKLGAGIVDGFIAVALSVYVLLDRENLLRAVKRVLYAFMKPNTFSQFSTIARSSDQILKGYLGGNILDAIIIGVATFLFMLIAGIPDAGLISVIIGVTNLIPTFGPFIGAIPSAFIILIIDPPATLWFIIFIFVLQQLDGNLIKPILFGNTAGIAPLWVLVSIIVFGRMFGLMGMLFGVPIFAILKLIFDAVVTGSIESRGLADVYAPIEEGQPEKKSRLFPNWKAPEKLVLRFGKARFGKRNDNSRKDNNGGE